jgi:ATP-dependent DNA ligase
VLSQIKGRFAFCRVRLFTRNGYDWSDRFPLIVEAALRNRQSSFVIDRMWDK